LRSKKWGIVVLKTVSTVVTQKNTDVRLIGKNIPGFRLVPSSITSRHPGCWTPTAARYFFCEDPECDVVYFCDDGSIIVTSPLRTRIGLKEKTNNGLLCYCFGVSNSVMTNNPAVKNYVIAQTKAGLCSCETSNPAGRCCLKGFPKPES
jgi:hypothetical protein